MNVGQTYTVKVDGFTGKESNTKPIPSENNPEWRRHNIKRAYPGSGTSSPWDYWYTSRVYGKGHIDVVPDFENLGAGKYSITTYCRRTRNRAKYPCYYEIIIGGKVVKTMKVIQYSPTTVNSKIDLGIFNMKKGDWVKMSDRNGTSSVSFTHVDFKKITSSISDIPVSEDEFCPQKYLKAYPDVAGDIYYKNHPYKHYLSSGFKEGRHHCPETAVSKKVIFEKGGHGFMSGIKLSTGHMLVGDYSGTETSKLYLVGRNEPIDRPKTGESIFRMYEDSGYVYMAVENYNILRDIVRQKPENYNFQHYKEMVPHGLHDGAFDVNRVLGKLILLGGGGLHVEGVGSESWGNKYYVKKILWYLNKALIVGYNTENNRAGWFESTNFKDWKWVNMGEKNWRFISGDTYKDGKTVILVGTINYKGGHHANSAAIWRYNSKGLKLLKVFKGYDYSSCAKFGPDSTKLYFLLTKRWKKHIPGAALMELYGNIKEITKFDRSEGREILFDGDNILCVLRSHGVGGKVVEVKNVINSG